MRQHDEWFDEPDDLDRVERAIAAIEAMNDPVEAAAVLACRLTRAQGFTEGISGRGCSRPVSPGPHDVDGATLLPPDDREFADLLVQAASGLDVEDEAVILLRRRRSAR